MKLILTNANNQTHRLRKNKPLIDILAFKSLFQSAIIAMKRNLIAKFHFV